MPSVVLSPHNALQKCSEQVSTQVDQDTVILNLKSGKYYSLEGVGSTIWQALDTQPKLEQLIHVISSQYNISYEQSQQDILSFLTDLHHAGLIHVAH